LNIKLTKAGKKYGSNWIFRGLSYQFNAGKKCAVLGPNGSGKSTLLKLLSGEATLSEGRIEFTLNNKPVSPEDIFTHVSVAAPWLDLPEEYSLSEIIDFHSKFKSFHNNLTINDIIRVMELEHTLEKHLLNFSSGMKQRVKLALAILSDTPLLLLDEPATALDAKAVKWYKEMIDTYTSNRTVIVFSNQREEEYGFCEEVIELSSHQL
jgi:ABC-type multidrug transport system ATPase subunit